jgi:hypothetical protein
MAVPAANQPPNKNQQPAANNKQQPAANNKQQPAAAQQGQPAAQQGPPKVGNPGLDPSTDPKIVVKAVNPPVTPDQVVGMAEMPAAATLDLPKIENIKIPPVKNKTIQGHLKAIEAKMAATEKLMKDVVKLQKVQILTEKELFERKRELYQNTFEEYLLDKTVDFENPDAMGGGSKKPKLPGGGGFPFFGGGRRGGGRGPGGSPGTAPVPSKNPKPSLNPAAEGTKVKPPLQPNPPGVLIPPKKEEPEFEPGFAFPDILKLLPFLFGPLLNPGVASNESADATTPLAFSNSNSQTEEFLRSGEFDAASQAAAPALTPKEALKQLNEEINGEQTEYSPVSPVISEPPPAVNPLQTMLDGFTNPKSLAEVTGLPISKDLEFALETVMMMSGGGALQQGAAKAPAIANTVRRLGVPFVSRVPGLKRLFGLSDDVAEITVKAGKAGTGVADDVAATTVAAPKPVTAVAPKPTATQLPSQMNAKELAKYRNKLKMQGGGRGRNHTSRKLTQSQRDQQSVERSVNALTGQPTPTGIQNQINTKSLQESFNKPAAKTKIEDFLKGSDAIPKIKTKSSGGYGDVQLYNSESLNYFRGMSSKIMPMADGGLAGWWNKGRNTRVPNENTARWRGPDGLMADDAKQITRSNKAFKSGATGMKGWNPFKAFTPDMVKTGPTPAVRQAFERPVRAVGRGINPSSALNPFALFAELIINELVNPASTATYDQVTGPNAYYNAPGYKGPMPSQNLENAQGSMMSGKNEQKLDITPLPPDYIKIPGKKKAPSFVGDDSPDIFMRTSVFTRSTHDSDID